MAFVTPENPETTYIEILEVPSVEDQCRNWKHPNKMLPTAPYSDILVSPSDVKEIRKCVLLESDISDETHESFHQHLDKYQVAFSTTSEDISHTELITVDIDSGLRYVRYIENDSDCQHWNLQRSNSTGFKLKQEVFIRRDEDWMNPWMDPLIIYFYQNSFLCKTLWILLWYDFEVWFLTSTRWPMFISGLLIGLWFFIMHYLTSFMLYATKHYKSFITSSIRLE